MVDVPKTILEIEIMNQYQNVAFERNRSAFIDTATTTEATFTARTVSANINGTIVPMVRGEVALRRETQAQASCGVDCPPVIGEAVKLSFTVEQGATNLSALRAEVDRLFDKAETEYNLTKGLVPPVYATFSV